MQWVAGLAVLMLVAGADTASAIQVGSTPTSTPLRMLVHRLRAAGSVTLEARTVRASPIVLEVYERRDFKPVWTGREDVAGLVRAVNMGYRDGLDPETYHRTALTELNGSLPLSPARAAALDLLATDALVRLSHDLRFGRLQPGGSNGVVTGMGPFGGVDPADDLLQSVASGDLEGRLTALRPTHFAYEGLVRGLAELRSIEGTGGWGLVPDGPTMKRGGADARVPLLRRRLALSGDPEPGGEGSTEPDPTIFDGALEEAVEIFQYRHGLNADGMVGMRTLSALNVPVGRRIDQVRASLERIRRGDREVPDHFVSVNIPGARVQLVRGQTVEFEARAVVGKDDTQTPEFSAPMTYVELNPTWTVPRGMVEEVLAAIRGDPHYLEDRDMRVLDSGGNPVDPSTLDFSTLRAGTFPYVLHQRPGPTNPLGRIKLVFPNAYAVYLHDTPARWAFAEERRLFSHGCIRMEDPVGLAVEVLDQPAAWSREALEDAISRGVTLGIPLARPVMVYVVYRTAAAGPGGALHFYDDVYQRDPGVLADLDAR